LQQMMAWPLPAEEPWLRLWLWAWPVPAEEPQIAKVAPEVAGTALHPKGRRLWGVAVPFAPAVVWPLAVQMMTLASAVPALHPKMWARAMPVWLPSVQMMARGATATISAEGVLIAAWARHMVPAVPSPQGADQAVQRAM
jgi:hypothetical protein